MLVGCFPDSAASHAPACTGIQPTWSENEDHYSGKTRRVYTNTADVDWKVALPLPLQAAFTTTAPPVMVSRCIGFYHYSGFTSTGGDMRWNWSVTDATTMVKNRQPHRESTDTPQI